MRLYAGRWALILLNILALDYTNSYSINSQERLKIAKEFGDKAAERRANSNLGNSHIFLGQFELAAEHYR